MRRVVVPLVNLISQWRRRRSFEGLWSIRKDLIELAGEHLKTLLNLCMQNETTVRSPFRWWWSQRKNNTFLPLFFEWRFQGKHNTKRQWTPLRYASIPHSLWANLPLSCMTVEDSFSVNDLYPISRVSVSADISIHRPLFCLSEVRNWIFFFWNSENEEESLRGIAFQSLDPLFFLRDTISAIPRQMLALHLQRKERKMERKKARVAVKQRDLLSRVNCTQHLRSGGELKRVCVRA